MIPTHVILSEAKGKDLRASNHGTLHVILSEAKDLGATPAPDVAVRTKILRSLRLLRMT